MSKTPIKRMQSRPIDTHRVTRPNSSIGVQRMLGYRFVADGDVSFPDGTSVYAYAETNNDGRSLVNLAMYYAGRHHHYYDDCRIKSRESLRRLAVAFAKRVTKEATARKEQPHE